MTELSDRIVDGLVARFEAARDPAAAEPMAAYMRNQFPFLGIPTTPRTVLMRDAVAGLPKPTEPDLIDATVALWARSDREYQYAALWLLRRHETMLTRAFVPTATRCITTTSWWDTVDGLAQHVIGSIVRGDRELESLMAEWLHGEDLWLARTSMLHQERWKGDTDVAILFDACLVRAADTEFFIRKAIGWALRSYSYVDPVAVERFVTDHDAELSGLSKREALKVIERERGRRQPSGRPAR